MVVLRNMEFDLLEYPIRKWLLAYTKLDQSIYTEKDEVKMGNEADSHHIYSNFDKDAGRIVQELEFWFDIVDSMEHKTSLHGLEKDPMLTNMLGKVIANIPIVYSSIVKSLPDNIVNEHKLKEIGFVTNEQTIIIPHINGEPIAPKLGIYTKNTVFKDKPKKTSVRDPLADAWKKMGF